MGTLPLKFFDFDLSRYYFFFKYTFKVFRFFEDVGLKYLHLFSLYLNLSTLISNLLIPFIIFSDFPFS
jgi:hypothetical protein